jgi:hypothetical protein
MLAGDIQVSCEPALRIFLDGKLAGSSNAKEDGFFLANVPEGRHVIRVEKDGFIPQSFQVDVGTLPVEVQVEAFVPQEPVRSTSKPADAKVMGPTGELLITSAPQNCLVELDDRSETKSTPVLRLQGLAAGQHSIAFSKPGYERLAGAVKVLPGGTVTVRGDLQSGKLETVAEGKGSLRIYSTPEFCTVRILGMTKAKIHTVLNLTSLPAGEHHLVVSWKGREQSTDVLISKGRRTVVTVSFLRGDEPFVVTFEPE